MAICRCEIAVVLSRLYFLYDLLLPAFYGVTEMDNGERENENDNKTETTGNEVTFRPTPRNYCKNCTKLGQCKLSLVFFELLQKPPTFRFLFKSNSHLEQENPAQQKLAQVIIDSADKPIFLPSPNYINIVEMYFLCV